MPDQKNKNRPKLLVIPSWYISPEDKINGSFFQAQGRVISNDFETRVIFLKRSRRPSVRKTSILSHKSMREWIDFLSFRGGQIELPSEDVFNNPKLFYYQSYTRLMPETIYQEGIVREWVGHVKKMIVSGWKPDLMRAHTAFPAGIVARRIKRKYNIPYILSEHKPFAIQDYSKAFRPEIKKAFDEADRVLSLSYDKVRQLAMSQIEVEPNIIFNMVDENIFKGLAKGYKPHTPIRIVTIGAASFYKDHKTLLRAVNAALKLGVRLHLTMIGTKIWGGDKLSETLNFIDFLNLRDHVTVIDELSREEIAEALPKFDVFLITSIQEGFPNSVLEALASGLFVIATRHGGTEDLIDDSMGFIAPVRNHEMISHALFKVFNGDIEFSPKAIRMKVIQDCGREAYRKKILHHYNEVTSSS